MILKNARVLDDGFEFKKQDVSVEGERIKSVGSPAVAEGADGVYDLSGLTLLPGLIDIHIHGSVGGDVSDGSREEVEKISSYLAGKGVTSFAAASMSLDEKSLSKAFAVLRDCRENGLPGAYLQGINMEGPYFSQEKRGAQNPEFIRKPDIAEFKRLFDVSGGMIKLVDVAPEVEGAEEFIRQASKICVVSVAHTTAGYDLTKKAFSWGASHCTHLFNAMQGLKHREPGTVGAVFDSDVTAELICDGIHIHPAVVRLIWKAVGPDRVVLISDAMSATGKPDGTYELGGLRVHVKDGAARVDDGSLAGSTANVMACVKNAVSFGIRPEDAVKAASLNPARVLKRDSETGSIRQGKLADLVAVDDHFDPKLVICKGKIVKKTI